MFAFCFVAIGPFLAEIKQIQYLTLKIKGQGHKDSPTVWCLCAFFAVLSKCYVPFYVKKRKLDNFMCLLEFECAKRLKAHSHAIPEVMAKVKTNGRIWTLEFNRYVCFLFHGNRTIFGWDIANSIFDLENSRSRSWQRSNRWSHLSHRVQLICLLFVPWQSDHFWLRYSKFYIWPWKCKVKVMAKVKPDGHIWALEFNRYVCILLQGNRTIFGWDIANSIFDLEKSRSRSRWKSTII